MSLLALRSNHQPGLATAVYERLARSSVAQVYAAVFGDDRLIRKPSEIKGRTLKVQIDIGPDFLNREYR